MSSPKSDLENQQVGGIEKCCKVCGQPNARNNYGALACGACAHFYRRTVIQGLRYVCKCSSPAAFSFAINLVKELKDCKFCRFEKCLQAGMQEKNIRSMEVWKWRKSMEQMKKNNALKNQLEANKAEETIKQIKTESTEDIGSNAENSGGNNGGAVKKCCMVCGQPNARNNFGTLSCHACAAFFRRTLIKNLRYVCHCGFANGKDTNFLCTRQTNLRNCKFCRFEKCQQVGMQEKSIRCMEVWKWRNEMALKKKMNELAAAQKQKSIENDNIQKQYTQEPMEIVNDEPPVDIKPILPLIGIPYFLL